MSVTQLLRPLDLSALGQFLGVVGVGGGVGGGSGSVGGGYQNYHDSSDSNEW